MIHCGKINTERLGCVECPDMSYHFHLRSEISDSSCKCRHGTCLGRLCSIGVRRLGQLMPAHRTFETLVNGTYERKKMFPRQSFRFWLGLQSNTCGLLILQGLLSNKNEFKRNARLASRSHHLTVEISKFNYKFCSDNAFRCRFI